MPNKYDQEKKYISKQIFHKSGSREPEQSQNSILKNLLESHRSNQAKKPASTKPIGSWIQKSIQIKQIDSQIKSSLDF
jgi:hypothetical protein